jgi:hypothetical protein
MHMFQSIAFYYAKEKTIMLKIFDNVGTMSRGEKRLIMETTSHQLLELPRSKSMV